MGMVLTYRQISFDTRYVPPGCKVPNSIRFFDADLNYVSNRSGTLTGSDEKALVRWMLSVEPIRTVLFEELGRSAGAFFQPEVVQPFFCPGEGDIDLILSELSAPQEAITIEAKLVKVEIVDPQEDTVRKLKDVGKGVRQANRLYDRFGFFQHYLAVITAVDASAQTDTNIPCRGLRSNSEDLFGDRKTFTQIVDFPKRDELKEEIGIIFLEIVQPSNMAYDYQATFRVCVQHRARCRQQSTTVTNRVTTLMAGGSMP
jgi:hypothetical protein